MKKRVNLSLDSETVEALRLLAHYEHCSMSQFVTDVIWEKMAPLDDFMNKPE